MTFPVNYDKFTILSAEPPYDNDIQKSINITYKPTFSFGG